MREFTEQENRQVAGLLRDTRFQALVGWLEDALQEANYRIYRSGTDREQHFATGGAIVIDAILTEIRKAPQELGDDNQAPILEETLC